MVPELDLSLYGIEAPSITGLDPCSVKQLVANDIASIILPTQHVKNPPKTRLHGYPGWELASDSYIADVLEKRLQDLTSFLNKIPPAVAQAFGAPFEQLVFSALSGDSHCGAQRPLSIRLASRQHVLKFADPRPYLLLREVLSQLSHSAGLNMTPPQITPDPDNQWCFLPYLPPFKEAIYEVDPFMFASGALTATAYCLRMVDLHLENVRVWNGLPVIIDPECILYPFNNEDGAARLRNTGLLSHDHQLSALRGGGATAGPMFSMGLHLCRDGTLDYYQPVNDQTNRIKEPSTGRLADPADYRDIFLAGYEMTFRWFERSKDLVRDIINTFVEEDFRIRFLVRKTRHYASVIHTLNLPCLFGYEFWINGVKNSFLSSGSFLENPPMENTVAAEWSDMMARDVPYFWIQANDRTLFHHSGPVQKRALKASAKTQALNDLEALSGSCLGEHRQVLEHFFDQTAPESAERRLPLLQEWQRPHMMPQVMP